MKEIDPGHEYLLDSYDGGLPVALIFMKREGEGYPFNVGHHPGTNCQEVIRALIARVRYLQKQIPCDENERIISDLRSALWKFELRAAKRHGRFSVFPWRETYQPIPIERQPVCARCGHVGCTVHQSNDTATPSTEAQKCVECHHNNVNADGRCKEVIAENDTGRDAEPFPTKTICWCRCTFPAVVQGEDAATLDPAIRQLVERLNAKGIKTFQSCSGHEDSESHPSACVWVEQAALSVERADRLSRRTGIEQVGLLFGREVPPVWEIKFVGETLPDFQAAQEAIAEHVAVACDSAEQQAREIVCNWRDEWHIPTPEPGDALDAQSDLIQRIAAALCSRTAGETVTSASELIEQLRMVPDVDIPDCCKGHAIEVIDAYLTELAGQCAWIYDPDGYWKTGCGDHFCITEGSPVENRMKWCHFLWAAVGQRCRGRIGSHMTRLLLTSLLALFVGILIGSIPTRRALSRCRHENRVLTEDLTRAVVRGVLIETKLNLCKEETK